MSATTLPQNRKAISSWPSARLLDLAEAHPDDCDLLEFIQSELDRRDVAVAASASRRVAQMILRARSDGHLPPEVTAAEQDSKIATLQARLEAMERRVREAEARASAAERALATEALPGRAIASTYAMGWQVQDYRGERMITHGGGAPGFISGTVLFPGRNVGFSYFTNAEEAITRALRGGIADIVLGKADFDWVADSARIQAEGVEAAAKAAAEIDAKQAAGAPPSLPLSAYARTWRDPWYGDIVIEPRDVQLWLRFSRTPALKGPLEPYDGETMRTRFPDKREEDAFITFALENGRPVRATLKGVSPDIDFSYDYQNLRLTRL